MARLKDLYKSRIVPELTREFDYKNPMAVPRMEKIVVSMGVGRAAQDKKFLELAKKDLMMITSQMPVVCKAKKSVSNFKVRQGNETGLKATVRRERMYEFMDRLISLAIPRVRDFRALTHAVLTAKAITQWVWLSRVFSRKSTLRKLSFSRE